MSSSPSRGVREAASRDSSNPKSPAATTTMTTQLKTLFSALRQARRGQKHNQELKQELLNGGGLLYLLCILRRNDGAQKKLVALKVMLEMMQSPEMVMSMNHEPALNVLMTVLNESNDNRVLGTALEVLSRIISTEGIVSGFTQNVVMKALTRMLLVDDVQVMKQALSTMVLALECKMLVPPESESILIATRLKSRQRLDADAQVQRLKTTILQQMERIAGQVNSPAQSTILYRCTPKALLEYTCDLVKWSDLYFLRQIGEGRYGNVFLAKYQGVRVCCKILKLRLTVEDAESILEEIRIMRRLKHPNVILLLGACLDPFNQVVIVTEYICRGNLKSCLSSIRGLYQRIRMGIGLARGLAWINAHDVVHRDLKLSNILVDEDYNVKISDFGLSLDMRRHEKCTCFRGNLKYSPPEILRARYDRTITIYDYGEKTDVYSFGLLLWELLSYKPLFAHVKNKEDFTNKIIGGKRPKLLLHWPLSIKHLLMACWHENASHRPFFSYIIKQLEYAVTDLMVSDSYGRKICRKIWLNRRDAPVSVGRFTRVFQKILSEAPPEPADSGGAATISVAGRRQQPNNDRVYYDAPNHNNLLTKERGLETETPTSLRSHNLRRSKGREFQMSAQDLALLLTVLCGPAHDKIEYERFCQVCRWFGPLYPLENFIANYRQVLLMKGFHGDMSTARAIRMMLTCRAGGRPAADIAWSANCREKVATSRSLSDLSDQGSGIMDDQSSVFWNADGIEIDPHGGAQGGAGMHHNERQASPTGDLLSAAISPMPRRSKSLSNKISKLFGTNSNYYVYRFSTVELGGFILTHVDREGLIYHRLIRQKDGRFYLDGIGNQFPDFLALHRYCKSMFKLQKVAPKSSNLIGV